MSWVENQIINNFSLTFESKIKIIWVCDVQFPDVSVPMPVLFIIITGYIRNTEFPHTKNLLNIWYPIQYLAKTKEEKRYYYREICCWKYCMSPFSSHWLRIACPRPLVSFFKRKVSFQIWHNAGKAQRLHCRAVAHKPTCTLQVPRELFR